VEQELLEVSAVGIPANPNALALAFKSGAIEKSDLQDTLDVLRLVCESEGRGQKTEISGQRSEARKADSRHTAEFLQLAREFMHF